LLRVSDVDTGLLDLEQERQFDDVDSNRLTFMGKRDRLFSWQDGERLVNESQGETNFVLLADGNHGCANVINHHRPLGADWMARYLGIRT
jgi:hypothetical protein